MFSTWALVVIAIGQLAPFVLRQPDIELIIDKFTVILLLILLYCRGLFKYNYIKAFILMLIILMGLLLINKLDRIEYNDSAGNELQVEMIGKTAIL